MSAPTVPMPPRIVRWRIATAALCDERAVCRYYRGAATRPAIARGIKLAIQTLNLPDPRPELRV